MTNPFQIQFTLRQHTPIIHFQHHQEGATLRATEVKPKLDRFLIEQFKQEGIDYKKWLVGDGTHPALDYKLCIQCEEEEILAFLEVGLPKMKYDDKTQKRIEIYETSPFPMVLANMGGKESPYELKRFKKYKTVFLTVKTLKTPLLEEIKKNITSFLLLNNFGNRQTKGFGSYFFDSNDPLYINPTEFYKNLNKKIVYFDLEKNDNIISAFSKIDIVYRLLKSGINIPKGRYKTYQKSFLIQYLMDAPYLIGSEKREIKEKLFDSTVRIKADPNLKNGNQYVRALLGVAGFYEYRDKERNNGYRKDKEGNVLKDRLGEPQLKSAQIQIEGNEVERFASPLLFKVIGNRVFIISEDWSDIADKSFTFSFKKDRTNIKTPNKASGINLENILESYTKYFNSISLSGEFIRLQKLTMEDKNDVPTYVSDYLDCLKEVKLEII